MIKNTNVIKLSPKKAFVDDFDYKKLELKKEVLNPWAPKTTADIFRNKQNIKIIKQILKDYKNKNKNNKPVLILKGHIGLGKTTLLKLCLSEEGFSYDILNQEFE